MTRHPYRGGQGRAAKDIENNPLFAIVSNLALCLAWLRRKKKGRTV